MPQHDDSKPGVKARGRIKIKGKAGMVVLQECKSDENASLFLVCFPTFEGKSVILSQL